MNFISEDKKTIKLPVPLGTIVYEFTTSCNDACLFQKEKFQELYPRKKGEGLCNKNMPCHTKLHGIQKMVVKLTNLEWILKNWHITIFETENQAKEEGIKFIEKHKNELLKVGLKIE